MSPLLARWRGTGIRTQSAVAAALVVAVALTVATGAFLALYREALLQRVDDAVTERATTVAADVRESGGAPAQPRRHAGETAGVVVLGPGSRADERWPAAVTRVRAGQLVRMNVVQGEDQRIHLVAVGVSTARGTYRVVAFRPLGPVGDSVRDAAGLLLLVNTVLLAIVATATWWFTGRSLQPVERIRAKVAGITAEDLGARVPVPGTRDEIGQLAGTMNRMLDRLEGAVTAQRRFVADASHELRSPLATVLTALDLLDDDALPAGSRPTLRLARQESERLGLIIDDLLLLARADEQALRRRDDDVDLDDLVVAERGRLTTAGTVKVTSAVEAVRVRGDRFQLARAIRNLADNAARHASTKVSLSVYRDGGEAVIEVADDGAGVAPADRARIFDRFVRLDGSRERGSGGSGLGLAIVWEIVVAHGGTVTVGDGACFRIRLPAVGRQEVAGPTDGP
ncbi:sensor histidine kinase [Cryptosporangium phraense]|uniref:histidine kinase n=1 Tax=Cryptosporangium phraense TaxID=2593070 RepID=A0A545AXM7_9ACTN|nr:HAMP domain-containing sensor histidine kinase [Cryptosporangium phraense]TQS46089.1 HAMP domain-containing histidine kinase [Cryptosporangium phraense]